MLYGMHLVLLNHFNLLKEAFSAKRDEISGFRNRERSKKTNPFEKKVEVQLAYTFDALANEISLVPA
jgi:hypothetical protein